MQHEYQRACVPIAPYEHSKQFRTGNGARAIPEVTAITVRLWPYPANRQFPALNALQNYDLGSDKYKYLVNPIYYTYKYVLSAPLS